jgi:cell division protease FtsH
VLRDGRLQWVRTDELREGEHLAMPRHIPTTPVIPSLWDFIPDEAHVRFRGARGHEVSAWERGLHHPSRGSLLAAVDEIEAFRERRAVDRTESLDELMTLAESAVLWTRIESIRPTSLVDHVYDLCLDRHHNFIANGLFTHNCIVFVDEIDAVGRHRGAGLGGGHDEREQTLNQLLVEMDGFDSNEGVIMIAATNRPDVLDPALLRPGRFDRQIVVDWPDVRGREGILKVHTRKIPLAEDVDLNAIARSTAGMAGADIANLVNEAALLAARRNRKKVAGVDFTDARDKVTLGMERKSLVMSEEERRSTAYHESGHALMAWLLPGSDPVDKISIVPRGRALGITSYVPKEERYARSKEDLLRTLAMMMGGRAAEFLIFQHFTTGAANDIERGTGLARKMVCELGMSENLGPLTFGKKEEMVFLGREIATHKDYSEQTAERIDEEVRALVEGAYRQAITLLEQNLDKLHLLAGTLLEREVLDGDQMNRLLHGEKLEPLKPVPAEPPSAAETPAAKSPEEQRPGAAGAPQPRPAEG